MTAADFDGNGTTDLAVANDWDNTVSVLLNNGNGTFAAAATYPTGNQPRIGLRRQISTGYGMSDLVTAKGHLG